MNYLLRGFALHFRCQHPEAAGLRVDVMSVMRGVEEFPKLWERRVSLADSAGTDVQAIAFGLVEEEKQKREKERLYWQPLKRNWKNCAI